MKYFAAAAIALLLGVSPAGAQAQSTSNFKSPDDGWFDLGGFMGRRGGFLPLAAPITEPAIGLGAAFGVAFVGKPPANGPPNMTAVGGLATDNGTRAAAVGDYRYWFNRRVQTLAAVAYGSINLDFHGVGNDPVLAGNPLRYNLEPTGGLLEARYRLGSSPVWIGAGYAYFQTGVRFDGPPETPGRPDTSGTSRVGGFTPKITIDTRDNLFTPLRGTFVDGRAGFFTPALGADDSFQRVGVIAIHYIPMPSRVYLGFRGEVMASFGDTPFYLKPFVYQRGVPAMRYQGDQMAQIETEVRWQFCKRLSAVAFAGGGGTWLSSADRNRSHFVAAGGLGARYEIARAYGIHIGADVAYGPAGSAFYIQFGSAWFRP